MKRAQKTHVHFPFKGRHLATFWALPHPSAESLVSDRGKIILGGPRQEKLRAKMPQGRQFPPQVSHIHRANPDYAVP
jgi:hypothetical protein